MRAVPQVAVDFISEHEKFVGRAYPDPGSKDGTPWTVGWGHTGPEVKRGYLVPRAKALLDLAADLEEARDLLYKRIKADVIDTLTIHQYAALLSFVFNLGAAPGWTIWKRLNAKAFDQVPGELMKFVNNDGKKMQGLVNRRAAEVVLWSSGEPGSTIFTPPSSITRSTPTPPTPSDPVPMQRDAGIITTTVAAVSTGATAAVSAAPDMIKQGIAVVSPYADKSETVQNMISIMATTAAVIAVIGLILILIKKWHGRR